MWDCGGGWCVRLCVSGRVRGSELIFLGLLATTLLELGMELAEVIEHIPSQTDL